MPGGEEAKIGRGGRSHCRGQSAWPEEEGNALIAGNGSKYLGKSEKWTTEHNEINGPRPSSQGGSGPERRMTNLNKIGACLRVFRNKLEHFTEETLESTVSIQCFTVFQQLTPNKGGDLLPKCIRASLVFPCRTSDWEERHAIGYGTGKSILF